MDLTNFPQVNCQSKSSSLVSWSLKQKSPNIQMQANFNNGFAFTGAHLNYIAATIGVAALNGSITLQDFSAIASKPHLTLSFNIPQDIVAGVTIRLTNLSEYNKLPHSPFLIQNLDLTYQLPAVTYLSPETIETLTTAGTATTAAMQAQAIASAVIPAITGGMSTSAMLLIGFLAEVDIYKYINVPFPDNFNLFCECIASNLLPNLFADFDDNYGANPNSTIGKFEFWGVSATLLDNSSAAIFKDLVVLGIIVGLNILMLIFIKCSELHSLIGKVRSLFMWNVFLSFYLGDYSELQLNAMIELREHSVSSLYSNVSLAFSITIVITYALLIIYIFYILNRKRWVPIPAKNRPRLRWYTEEEPGRTNSKLKKKFYQEQFSEVPQCIAIISEDFVWRNAFTRNFFLIMMFESFLLVLLVFFFQDYGVAQAIIYTILTLLYVVIIAWQRPYKSKFQLILLLINQISKVGMGVISVIIGINEQTNSIPQESITQMGNALILLIVIVIGINLLISLLITAVELIRGIRRIVRYYLSKNSTDQKLQQGSSADHISTQHGQYYGRRFHSRSGQSHRTFETHRTTSTTSNNNSTEDSFDTTSKKAKTARRELIARAIALRTGDPSHITLSKTSLHSNSTGMNDSMNQSRTALILPQKSNRKKAHNDDRLERIRELGRIRRAQRAMALNVQTHFIEPKKRSYLPSED